MSTLYLTNPLFIRNSHLRLYTREQYTSWFSRLKPFKYCASHTTALLMLSETDLLEIWEGMHRYKYLNEVSSRMNSLETALRKIHSLGSKLIFSRSCRRWQIRTFSTFIKWLETNYKPMFIRTCEQKGFPCKVFKEKPVIERHLYLSSCVSSTIKTRGFIFYPSLLPFLFVATELILGATFSKDMLFLMEERKSTFFCHSLLKIIVWIKLFGV